MNSEPQAWWEIPDGLDTEDFDFEWMPDVFDPPLIHQFGTQWQKTGGPRYVVEGATKIKYQGCQQATRLPTTEGWAIPDGLDLANFDLSWHPDGTEPPVIYQFGTQWRKTGGPRYMTPGGRKIIHLDFQRATRLPDMKNWKIPPHTAKIEFDFSWHPDPSEHMTNWVFGDGQSWFITYISTGYPNYRFMSEPTAAIQWNPLDIFYLSNGEPCEEDHYQRLCQLAGRPVRWVRGVDGRERAIKEAARQSATPYFILFPAKVWADPHFPWDFQPTHYHIDQHYIFYARNPVNGLLYGHQAAVCYNRELVLTTTNWGLDFTMSAPHTVVPTLCGEARYNVSPYMTWRTAFREAIKLRAAGDGESLERLETWVSTADPGQQWSEWSTIGAREGVEYWRSVEGRHGELMQTFEWGWLNERWRTVTLTKYPDEV